MKHNRKPERQITIVLTTRYLEEAHSLSDRIGIMAKGRLTALGTSDKIIREAKADNFEDAFLHFAREGAAV
ncbi:MAG: hypothetical protein ACOX7O_08450 [Oscillospiraceae bacterium]